MSPRASDPTCSHPGAIARVAESLDVGLGATFATSTRATSAVYTPDAADQRVSIVNASVDVASRVVPYAGLAWRPAPSLETIATIHLPYRSPVDATTDVKIWSYPYPPGQSSLAQSFSFACGDEPLRAAIGASLGAGDADRACSIRTATASQA